MLAYPGLIVGAAKNAEIDLPEDIEPGGYDPEQYPHWAVFCNVQLGAPMPSPSQHYINAEIIAKIYGEKIFTITAEELVDLGVV